MLLITENSLSISEKLHSFSDDFFVDECDCSFDPDLSVFQAVFVSTAFAKCLVTKTLPAGTSEITDDELQRISGFANAELERQLNEIGMKATFNASTGAHAQELPEGYTLEIVYEDAETDPSAPGIDWLAIA